MSPRKPKGLRDLEVFCGLSEAALVHLESHALGRRYAPGDVVVREGDSAREMFLVLSGRVTVRKGASGVELGTLGPGECLGEMALLDVQPRSATVVVSQTADLLMVDEAVFHRLEALDPRSYGRAVTNIAIAMASRLRRLNEQVEARNLWCVVY